MKGFVLGIVATVACLLMTPMAIKEKRKATEVSKKWDQAIHSTHEYLEIKTKNLRQFGEKLQALTADL
ncbi:MAG: hypothetical protein R3B54_07135 [Bdellovibrionota bacterium]